MKWFTSKSARNTEESSKKKCSDLLVEPPSEIYGSLAASEPIKLYDNYLRYGRCPNGHYFNWLDICCPTCGQEERRWVIARKWHKQSHIGGYPFTTDSGIEERDSSKQEELTRASQRTTS